MKTENIKKVVVAVMAMVITVGTAITPAKAANTSNTNFNILISGSTVKRSSTNAARAKQNSTSTYVNYKVKKSGATATGPTKFRAYVYGGTSTSNLVDCSSYTSSGKARPAAIITKGTKGYIMQLVYETFKNSGKTIYAQMYGSQYSTYTGTAIGCWSPDSVSESGTVAYNY